VDGLVERNTYLTFFTYFMLNNKLQDYIKFIGIMIKITRDSEARNACDRPKPRHARELFLRASGSWSENLLSDCSEKILFRPRSRSKIMMMAS
jgi:hypothetical protein